MLVHVSTFILLCLYSKSGMSTVFPLILSVWFVCLRFVFVLSCLGYSAAAAAIKLLQLCLILYDPIDGSPPVSPIPGVFQARTREWAAISFSNA